MLDRPLSRALTIRECRVLLLTGACHADSDRQMTARRHYRVVSPIFCNVRPMVFRTLRGLLLDAGATI